MIVLLYFCFSVKDSLFGINDWFSEELKLGMKGVSKLDFDLKMDQSCTFSQTLWCHVFLQIGNRFDGAPAIKCLLSPHSVASGDMMIIIIKTNL